MNISTIFDAVFYKPLFNLLILLYNYIPDFGVAVIVLTLITRFALYPLTAKSLRSQKKINAIQGKIKKLQEKYKDDKQKLTQETMALYKQEGVNPVGGCLPILLQLPILIAIYSVFGNGLKTEELAKLYSFIHIPEFVSPLFLGLIDLSQPNTILALVAGVFQFIQMKMTMKNTTPQKGMPDFSKMAFIFPIVTVMIVIKLPSVIAVYWIVTTIFSIIQYLIINKNLAEPCFLAKLENKEK